MRRYAFALLGDRHRADDLVQDTLERALRKRHLWSGRGSIRNWMFRILYRNFLNGRKTFDQQRMMPVSDMEPYAEPIEGDQVARLALSRVVAGLAELSPEHRAAILLVALEDIGYDEAARILGIPIGTLRSRVSRGRENLRLSVGCTSVERLLRSVK